MSAQIEILIAQIQDELGDLEKLVERADAIYERTIKSQDDVYFDALALNMHSFYMGIEHIFENIARTVEDSVPSGSSWHRELLRQMTLEIPSVRPPVIQKETGLCLDEYLRFRHVVRHGYTFNLQMSRVQKLAGELRDCFTAVSQDLDQFIQFLQQLPRE